jgi:hypothetical protein
MSTKAIVIVAFALSTAITSSAPAQTRSRSQMSNRGAYAQQTMRTHSARRSNRVYSTRGRYRGTDPDPFIRNQLRRCHEC